MARIAMCVLLSASLAALSFTAGTAAEGRVIVTIKPVHSLAAALLEGAAAPELLIEGSTSPHTFTLKPSAARALAKAELIVRVGAGLETALEKPLESLGARARIVTLAELEGLTVLPYRKEDGHEKEAGHKHEAGTLDPHIWLDPANARLIAAHLAKLFAGAFPGRAEVIAARAAALDRRLETLDAALRAETEPLKDTPYVLFHDGYRYFETRYGLEAAGVIAVHPERPPGARRVTELRAKIRKLGAVCVFGAPQFEPRIARALISGTKARLATLDPLGAGLEPGPDLYFTLMRNLAGALRACLEGGPEN